MNILGSLSSAVKKMVPSRANAIDTVVIEHKNGVLKSTKFYLFIGTSLSAFADSTFIEVQVNGHIIPGVNLMIAKSGNLICCRATFSLIHVLLHYPYFNCLLIGCTDAIVNRRDSDCF